MSLPHAGWGYSRVAERWCIFEDARECQPVQAVAVVETSRTPSDQLWMAKLIAAAPDLFRACEQARFWLRAQFDNPHDLVVPDEILKVLDDALESCGKLAGKEVF